MAAMPSRMSVRPQADQTRTPAGGPSALTACCSFGPARGRGSGRTSSERFPLNAETKAVGVRGLAEELRGWG